MYSGNYKEEDIEFANRILNRREELSEAEVTRWLASADNRKLLDEVSAIKRILSNQQYDKIKAQELYRLRKTINRRRIYLRRWWLTAAVSACFIGIGLWPAMSPLQEADNRTQTQKIVPGSTCAELILAGGESITLDNSNVRITTKTISGIVNDSVEGLNYSQVAVVDKQLETAYHTLRVPIGGFYKLKLPDGTKVWLNSASELKFPTQFNGTKREVYLQGEGYFEVSQDTSCQFVVHLNQSAVTVLGTIFNITAYEDEDYISTTLVEGKVTFYSQQQQQQVLLHPGMQSVMEIKNGTTITKEVDPSIYTAWIDGRFVFRTMDLEAIFKQLQRWYNFKVLYKDPEVKKYTFWGVIKRDMKIEEVLKIIESTTDVHFSIEGQTIIVNK